MVPAWIKRILLAGGVVPLLAASAQSAPFCPAPLAARSGIEVGFSPTPRDQALRLVLGVIGSARRELRVAAYVITSREIIQALETAARCGVKVSLLVDLNQGIRNGMEQRLQGLRAAGAEIRVIPPDEVLHDKFIILDDQTVQTGSFNYSFSAQRRNIENVIVLWNDSAAAKSYTLHFMEVWEKAATL